jgi:hypothetical protein
MAWSIQRTGSKILQLLQKNGIVIPDHEVEQLLEKGHANICGFNCKSVNVLGNNSFRVIVCKEWFSGNHDLKPTTRTCRVGFEYQLIPTSNYLYTIYYLELRDYARQLEKDKERWIHDSYWGMEVDEKKGLFTWKGGNILKFPLQVLSSPLDLFLREKQYHEQRKIYTSLLS